MEKKHTPLKTWVSGFMTAAFICTAIAAYSFATNRLVVMPDVVYATASDERDCNQAEDAINCLIERAEANRVAGR